VFAGWREDVADLMALMDLFVLPSWREGVPRAAIEAAASGLPLVLTDIRGCREVIRHDIEGLLVPVRNPKRLAGAIAWLLDDPSARRRMGAAARRRAEELFDERRVVATVTGATRALLAAAGRLPVRGSPDVCIRRARPGDAAAMARLHRESLPTAFLPTLGDRFLRRLYGAMTRDADAVALVAEERDLVVGFAAAVPSIATFYRRFVRRQGIASALVAAPHLARPSVVRRLIETARYPTRLDGVPDAELLSIAVDPSCRSRGVGSALARAAARALAEQDVREFKVVVGAENDGANRFYEGLGFRSVGPVALHAGVPSNVWVTACPS
jgi:ribosomal protein S18 acetylase RimI-like enzyme